MPVSVEARAIRSSERTCDLFLASVHLPDQEYEPIEIARVVAQLVDLPITSIVSQDELKGYVREVPAPLGGHWGWGGTSKQLFERFLMTAAVGNFSSAISPTQWETFPPFPSPHMLEEFWMLRRRLPDLGMLRSSLALDLSLRLCGSTGPTPDIAQDLEQLLDHEVPYSHSPTVGGLSLRGLADKARYVVLFPLAAGSSQAVNAMYKGEWTAAIYTALASGGATLVFVSTLWIADKLFNGVKHLDGTPARRQQPAAPKGRQKAIRDDET
jgi:hypothetical protein